MEQPLSSKALEANLAETYIEEIVIPVEYQQFVDLSISHWGIHKTAQDLILEYHHPYSNRQFVVEHLRQILLRDLWFYNSLADPETAFAVLIDISENLLQSDLEEELKEKVIQTLLEFVGSLSKQENILGSTIHRCLDVLRDSFARNEIATIRNARYFKTYLAQTAQLPELSNEVFELTKSVLEKCICFWEATSDSEAWFQGKKPLFFHDYGDKIIQIGSPFFFDLREQFGRADEWHSLMAIPSFDDIANHFRRFVDEFDTSPERIYFIFHLLNTPGMHHLKDNLLWDINRLLRNIHKQLDVDRFIVFSGNLLDLFEELKSDYAGTVLDCLLTLGKEVIATQDKRLISYYEERLLQLGFITPGTISISKDWQIQVNVNHIKNIRIWLEIIECAPPTMRNVVSALIVNLRLGGIFVSDTDLFQRDITKLLNSDIAPIYKQIKDLARIFPVYFTEIGAEGELRDVTTAIDEVSQRRDRLIHFLRKQTHTESNNTHIELTQKIIQFWSDGELDPLRDLVPADVVESIDLEGELFVPIHEMVRLLCEQFRYTPQEILEVSESELGEALSQMSSNNERDKKRLEYLIRIYALLKEKYSLKTGDINLLLKKYSFVNNEDIENLSDLLAGDETEVALGQVYGLMRNLNQVILDTKCSEGWENIYRKRHIAAGIPSMYGEYRERKFEALGLLFRLEKIASRLMEQMIRGINLEYITQMRLQRIYEVLDLFQSGLEIDGISSQGFNSNLAMLKSSFTSATCSVDQYVNIFEFLQQNVKDIIDKHFLRIYDQPLRVIIPQLVEEEQCLPGIERKEVLHKKSEEFYREILSSAFLIQDLDNFVSDTLNALRNMADHFSRDLIRNAMTYDPEMIISSLYMPTPQMDDQIFLGAKAYFLKKLYSLGFPVPPGFVLTTEFFRHKDAILEHPQISGEIDELLKAHIAWLEEITGQNFGDPENPLLLAVRSGTAISMPGAMATFLNVGMNDKITQTLSKQRNLGWTAWDCYRRFLQSWGMTYGIDRGIFDEINLYFESHYGVQKGSEFTAEQMEEIAREYKKVLHKHDIHFQDDPFLQLKQAIWDVIDSWDSDRVVLYRDHLGIASEWGTAVIIQKMVLGNISSKSGTGALFTNDPHESKSDINIYGDFTLCSQGEDIVTGWVHTLPVTEHHRMKYHNDTVISLESTFPATYQKLIELSTQLVEQHGFGHQEIEFTFESDNPEDLYILQTRRQDILKHDKRRVFDVPHDKLHLVGRGIGIGGGALNGILAFDMDDLECISEKSPSDKRILVRPDTVPDDIGMIFNCDGLLTGKGGATSHAAVTAARLGKVCVVGCKDLRVNEAQKTCVINGITFRTGDEIAIDGHLGNVYEGHYPTEVVEIN